MYFCGLFWWKWKFHKVCNFQSIKSPVELNSLLSKFSCYITWLLYQLVVISWLLYLHYKLTVIDKQQSVSLNIMSVHLSDFADFLNIFTRYRSKQSTSKLSVMATRMVLSPVFSSLRNHFCWTKMTINLVNVFSRPAVRILFKFNTCLVNIG